jgi:uncharacterized SAM-binding protein YcdF (DUF218 family)
MIIIRILKYILITFGTACLILIILCFTSAPFWTLYGLATKNGGVHRPPEYIVVLGGGGMPSESAFMRTWYAAKVANRFTRSKVIIALPGDTSDSQSSVNLMRDELILRGVERSRIMLEPLGTNTRAEAINIYKRISNPEKSGQATDQRTPNAEFLTSKIVNRYSIFNSILIVTAPEHINRAVLTFKKAGFKRVDGLPAFENTLESDLTFNDRSLGGRRWLIPGIGGNINLRYQFWTQMRYEVLIIREMFATGYYKLKGWI